MPTKVIRLDQLGDELKKLTEATLEKQKKALASGFARSIPDLVAASPVDTGLYAQSWNFSITEESAILGNTAPHAPIIEYGARPFTPPIKPLLEWAKRVLQDPSQPPNYSKEVRQLAYGVQKKISEQGMKPRHVLTNMIPKIIQNVLEELEKLG